MKSRPILALMTSLILVGAAAPALAQAAQASPLYANPITLPTEDGPLTAEEGYVAVPENRSDPNSRKILVQYYRFRSIAPSGLDPVFILPGGPGDLLDRRDFDKKRYPHFTIRKILRHYLANRDVVIVNQRGNFWLIDNFGGFRAEQPRPASADPTQEELIDAWKTSLDATFTALSSGGVDLKGYDIKNMVDDIDDLRASLGYSKIILDGFSFGSQWGLGYIRAYPQHVARAMFSGVEPLDYGYDSPDALWATLGRIADAAEASPIAPQLPRGGLRAAVLTILDRLEDEPAKVTINDAAGQPVEVTIRREDFQALLMRPWSGRTLREAPEAWPKFVTEVYNGDYRYVALRKLDGLFPFNGNINLPLVDHSLGISPARDAMLQSEAAVAILGDPNLFYRRWNDIIPTEEVADDFRVMQPIDVPVLLVAGDMDWSAPMENAIAQGQYLKTGAVVRVRGGTHIVGYEVMDMDPGLASQMLGFINLDQAPNPDPKTYLATLPKEVSLPVEFMAPDSESLYDRLVAARVSGH